MKSKKAKIVVIAACALVGAILLAAISYLLYVVLSYYRVEDNRPLTALGENSTATPVGETLSLVTYNIGFCAYSDDYSFFMDGGEHSRAYSKEAVLANLSGTLGALKDADADFLLLQEVDVDGDRSYHVDEAELLRQGLEGYVSLYAQNYDSPYFFYPFSEPIGANKSGLLTFSSYAVAGGIRRSLPIENSFYKYLDLDRAYTMTTLPTANGKQLLLYNVHLSAYTSDGSISDEQLKMLAADMQAQYEKGNYVIAAGDFNKDLLGDSSKYFTREGDGEFTWAKPLDFSLLPEGFTCHSGTNAPTCRNADSAYRADGTDFVLSVDGLIVSPNVELVSAKTVDLGFQYSDHNPVRAEFVLK